MKYFVSSLMAVIMLGSIATHAGEKETLLSECEMIVKRDVAKHVSSLLGRSVGDVKIGKIKKLKGTSELTGKSVAEVSLKMNGQKVKALVHDNSTPGFDGSRGIVDCIVTDVEMD